MRPEAQEAFDKASNYLYRHARPLEFALYNYHFEGGSKEDVMRVLSRYQNEDGGFGSALDVDSWNTNSTPLHAAKAIDIILEIDFDDKDHPVIAGLLKWIESGACCVKGHWADIHKSENEFPRAHWLDNPDKKNQYVDYGISVRFAAFILRFERKSFNALERAHHLCREYLADFTVFHKDATAYLIQCCIKAKKMVDESGIEVGDAMFSYKTFTRVLGESVHSKISKDISEWSSYSCRPSTFFNSKQSEFYYKNRDLVKSECDYLIATQLREGVWSIPWIWNEFYQEYLISKGWYESIAIINNLLFLSNFDK